MQARLLLVLVICLSAVIPAVAPAAAGNQTDQTLDRRLVLSLTPQDPGAIRVRATFDVPDRLTSLTTVIPEDATVLSKAGFRQESETRYVWDSTTDNPSVTYRFPVNRSTAEQGAVVKGDTAYTFVDVGAWALVRTPQVPVRYSGFGTPPEVTRDVVIEGSGVAGTAMSYLGQYSERIQQVDGQTIRLVVPDTADITAGEETVLTTLAASARAFTLGTPDEEVIAFAAPTTVRWSSPGLQRGSDEFWVRDTQPVDSAGNIWAHEYVHTRQGTSARTTAQWLVEGGAEYYASLLTLEQGRTDYEAFHRHLAFGTRRAYADSILTNRSTWTDTGANYWKGALVAAAIDRKIRLATDREYTLLDVYDRVDDGEFTNRELLAEIGEVAGSDTRTYARTYTTTEAAPKLWNESQHDVAFGDAAATTSEIEGVEVNGPYRNETVDSPVTVVPGEHLHLAVRMTNTGPVPGEFSVSLVADGDVVARRTDHLDEGTSTTVTFERSYRRRGDHTLAVGGRTIAVRVREPASPTVTDVDAPATVAARRPVTLRARVHNDADRPAHGSVPVTVDGEQVAAPEIRLAPGASTTIEVPVDIEAGEHSVAVGDVTVTVTGDPSRTGSGRHGASSPDTTARATTDSTGDGFGVAGALVALVVLLLLQRR